MKNEVKNTMRTITRTAASLALLFAFAAAAAAQSSKGNGNDSVDYAPKTQNLAGTLPFDRSYTLDITSPSKLNDNGEASPRGLPRTCASTSTTFRRPRTRGQQRRS